MNLGATGYSRHQAPTGGDVAIGAPDPGHCAVNVSSPSGIEGGTLTVTLTAYDWRGSRITSGGANVTFGNSGGTSVISIGTVTDNGNGTYSATITLTTAGTATTISATVNSATVITSMPTVTVQAPGSYGFFDDFSNQVIGNAPTTALATYAAAGYTWGGTAVGSANAIVKADPTGVYSKVLALTFFAKPPGGYDRAQMDYRYPYTDRIWREYFFYAPGSGDTAWSAAYVHRLNGSGTNNKWAGYVWGDQYGGSGGCVLAGIENEMYGSPLAEYPRPTCNPSFSTGNYNASKFLPPSFNYYPNGYAARWSKLIDPAGALPPGNWFRLRFMEQRSSSAGALDGIMRLRRATGPAFNDDTTIYNVSTCDFYACTSAYPSAQINLNSGYFMGEANSGYDADTTFLIANVKISLTDPGWTW